MCKVGLGLSYLLYPCKPDQAIPNVICRRRNAKTDRLCRLQEQCGVVKIRYTPPEKSMNDCSIWSIQQM